MDPAAAPSPSIPPAHNPSESQPQPHPQSHSTSTPASATIDGAARGDVGQASSGDWAPTTFSAAHLARAALASHSAKPSELHLLHSSVQRLHTDAPVEASSSSTASGLTAEANLTSSAAQARLSRQQFRSLVSQIRQAAIHFARNSPALTAGSAENDLHDQSLPQQQQQQHEQQQRQPPPQSQVHAIAPQAGSVPKSNAVRRYVSLLAETSKHMVQLRHSVDSFSPPFASEPSPSPSNSASTVSDINSSLALLRAASLKGPSQDHLAALEVLNTLGDVLGSQARSLGLETFAEKADPVAELTSDGQEALAHTLTVGAKILVIDVELLLLRSDARMAPIVRLKLSYANDSDQAASAHPVGAPLRDPRLAALLQEDVQTAAALLFGQRDSLPRPERGREERLDRIEQVARCFRRFGSSLGDLVKLDEVAAHVHEAALGPHVDVFDAMQRLSGQVERVADAEAAEAASLATKSGDPSRVSRILLERGHGVATVHTERPFLEVVYAQDETSRVDYKLSLEVIPLAIPAAGAGAGVGAGAAATTSAPVPAAAAAASGPSSTSSTLQPGGTCSWPLGSAASALFEQVKAETDPASSLGHLTRGSAATPVPLRFVARLDPPVVVTRSTAARLASICGLPSLNATKGAALSGPASHTDQDGAIWFEDVLSTAWSQRSPDQPVDSDYRPRCSFTLARTPESLRDPRSQGLVVDALPFVLPSREDVGAAADAMDVDAGAGSAGLAGSHGTVVRLFAAIEALRDEVRTTELAHSALALSERKAVDAVPEEDVTLDDLLEDGEEPSSAPATIPVVIVLRGTGVEALSMELACTLSLKASEPEPTPQPPASFLDLRIVLTAAVAHEEAWTVETVSTLRAGVSAQVRTLAADSDEARRMAERVSRRRSAAVASRERVGGLEALDDVVGMAVEWSEAQFGVAALVPAAARRGESRSRLEPESNEFDPLAYEERNVHAVYETIAPHFSSTRYKPWPLIPLFLSTLPPGSLGADLGCGNGKYLPIRSMLASQERGEAGAERGEQSLLTVGVDRSSNLLGLAQTNFGILSASGGEGDGGRQGFGGRRVHEVAVGDALMSGFRSGVFDYALSIATIHHFSTQERRIQAVRELIRLVRPVEARSGSSAAAAGHGTSEAAGRLNGGCGPGRFMIFAWALEQREEGGRRFEGVAGGVDAGRERMVSESGVGGGQDLLVPWVMAKPAARGKGKAKRDGRAKRRDKGAEVQGEGAVEAALDQLSVSDDRTKIETEEEAAVYQRYYHVFRRGELEELVERAAERVEGGVVVVCEVSGWERGNWWGIWRVQSAAAAAA